MAGARRHGGGLLNAEARRPLGLLLLWASVGLFFGAATAPLEHDLYREAARNASGELFGEIPSPTLLGVGLTAGLATLALLGGVVLLAAPRGRSVEPPIAEGSEAGEAPTLPRTCWRCREAWPSESQACPRCGAERLLGPS